MTEKVFNGQTLPMVFDLGNGGHIPLVRANLAMPDGGATEATLAALLTAVQAQKDNEFALWTDNSGDFFIMRIVVNAAGTATITFTDPAGTAATPGAGLKPAGGASGAASENTLGALNTKVPASVNGRMPVQTDERPSASAAAITTSDTVLLPGGTTRGIYVGGAGNVVALIGGSPITFTAVPAGSILPVQATRVNQTGTTATALVALF